MFGLWRFLGLLVLFAFSFVLLCVDFPPKTGVSAESDDPLQGPRRVRGKPISLGIVGIIKKKDVRDVRIVVCGL